MSVVVCVLLFDCCLTVACLFVVCLLFVDCCLLFVCCIVVARCCSAISVWFDVTCFLCRVSCFLVFVYYVFVVGC